MDAEDNMITPEDSASIIDDEIKSVELSPEDTDDNVGEQEIIFELPLGDAMTIEETYKITAAFQTKFIVLVGPQESGKTTLVTTIYQLFQTGPIDKYFFAGSKSLKGFESRAFNTRVTSGNSHSQTPKTRRGISDSILHLKLWNSIENSSQDLLISDFSGEDYNSAIANIDLMKSDFSPIKRADRIVVLLDGELISKKTKRNSTQDRAIELIQTIYDAGLFG